jgi:monofunctional biosynthetic peptidoglycan transglycosylase
MQSLSQKRRAMLAEALLVDFRKGRGDSRSSTWQSINDEVMGGRSTSRFELRSVMGVFQGEVSLENHGGFASVRTEPARFDVNGYNAFLLRARGDGKRYKFLAHTTALSRARTYQRPFSTRLGVWEEYRLPFVEMIPTLRGRALDDELPFDAQTPVSLGFLIADQQAGAFRLEVAWIKAVQLASV